MEAFARPAESCDAHWLAPRLRQADVAEIKAASGDAPLVALRNAIRDSDESFTIIGDRPIGIFGVGSCPILPGLGIVWMVATDELRLIARDFIRQTPEYLDRFHERYPVLGNFVDERNELHIRWLKRVGFIFINRHPVFGHEQRPFLEFCKLRDH